MKFYIKPTYKQPRNGKKFWDLIRDSIHNTVHRESDKKYRLLGNKITRLKETQVEKTDNTYKLYPSVINQTDIKFTNGKLALLNNGSKYKVGYKHKYWIRENSFRITGTLHEDLCTFMIISS